jgi:uncharacterized protein YdhG (YjbR/CyaY superfamily)
MDDYLAGLEDDQRAALQHVREVVREAVPDAEEGTSYGMPAFRWNGKPLLGFRAAKKHLSLFPFSPAVIDALTARLDGFELSKGTIRFTAQHQLQDDVLRDVVMLRLDEIS